MAQGDKFEFGIAYPLKNHKFRKPTEITLNVNSNGTDNIIVEHTYDSFAYQLGVANRPGEFDSAIITSSDGATSQNVTIRGVTSSVSVTILYVLETMTSLAFNSGTIKIQCTGVAGAWTVPDSGTGSDQKTPLTIIPPGGGKNDRYSQYLACDNQSASAGFITGGLQQQLTLSRMQECTAFRVGLDYKFNSKVYQGNLISNLGVYIDKPADGSTPFSSMVVVNNATPEQTEWNAWSDSFVFWKSKNSTEYTTQSDTYLKIILLTIAGNKLRSWVDNVFLEHAYLIESADTIMSVATSGSLYTVTLNRQASELGWAAGDEVIVSNYKAGTDNRLYWHCNRFQIDSASSRSLNLIPIGTVDTELMAENAVIHKNTGGYYQVNDHPIQSSISYDRVPNHKVSPQAGGDVRSWYPMTDSDLSERWVFSCSYVNVSQSIYDAFQNILRWQERGEYVAFHPYIDDLPSVMIGRIALSGYTKGNLWDLTTCSFNLSFTEVLI